MSAYVAYSDANLQIMVIFYYFCSNFNFLEYGIYGRSISSNA